MRNQKRHGFEFPQRIQGFPVFGSQTIRIMPPEAANSQQYIRCSERPNIFVISTTYPGPITILECDKSLFILRGCAVRRT